MNIYKHLRRRKASYDFHSQLRKDLTSPEVILVHQMGKVGSSTVVASLKALNLASPVLHTHRLNPAAISDRLEKIKEAGREVPLGSHLITSQYLSSFLGKESDRKSWKVITLVREPIIQNISGFFQNIEQYVPDCNRRYLAGKVSTEQIIQEFLDHYTHDHPLHWLESEIKDVFGIDIYSERFPIENGYQIFQHRTFSLLVIRLEDLNWCFQKAFREFMAIDNLELKHENIAKDKENHAIYQAFKSSIRLPQSYIERMYSSKYMTHFYTDKEISAFKQKWLKE